MSWKVQQAVFQSDLPGITKNRMQAKLVLLALAHFADEAGENVRPAVATVAKMSSCSVRTVQVVIKTLIATDLVVQQAPASQHRPTTYRVDVARLSPGVQQSAGLTTSAVQTAAPLTDSGVQAYALRGAGQGDSGVQTAAPDLTYGNLRTNIRASPEHRRVLDAHTLAEQAYEQLTPTSLDHLERDARRELGGLLSLQPPEKVPTLIRKHVQLYLRDPRVRQEFLGAPPAQEHAISAV